MSSVIDELRPNIGRGRWNGLSSNNGEVVALEELFDLLLRATSKGVVCLERGALLGQDVGRDMSDEQRGECRESGAKPNHD